MTSLSRRHFLQTAAAGLATSGGRGGAVTMPPTATLGDIAARNGFLFGSAAAQAIDTDAAYRELYVTQTKLIASDVALKIGAIAPQPGPKHFEPR